MLVDPNTGMPMDSPGSGVNMIDAALEANNTSAGILSGIGQKAGFMAPGSVSERALDLVPGISQTTAWNTFRGSRAIINGTRNMTQVSGINATLNPRYLFNMPSVESLGGASVKNANYAFNAGKYKPAPPGGAVKAESYTPFNILARSGNYIFNKAAKRIEGSSLLSAEMAGTKRGKAAARVSAYAKEGDAFGIGTLARVNTSFNIGRGAKPIGNAMNFIERTDETLFNNINRARASRIPTGGTMSPLTRQQGAHAIGMSTEGAISSRVSGYINTLNFGAMDVEMRASAKTSGKTAYTAGSKAAVRTMNTLGVEVGEKTGKFGSKFILKEGGAMAEILGRQSGKVGFKTVGELAMKTGGKKMAAKLGAALAVQAVPGVGQVVGAVLLADLAMDLGKLGAASVRSGIDFAKEAAISYKGSIQKGTMGMGYRDNTVAATSRARGVQAIQNSRLNARSVLGSEAGAMHAHFG